MRRIAELWDRIPVQGKIMTGAVAIVGAILGITAPNGTSCTDANGLSHVYHPQRLHVLATCQHVRFQVVAWRREHDGDYHVNGRVLDDDTWINQGNIKGQHGYTVAEFVPGDPKPPKWLSGEILDLTCTKVEDWQHAGHWVECHRVFDMKVESANGSPQNPIQLAPATEDSHHSHPHLRPQ